MTDISYVDISGCLNCVNYNKKTNFCNVHLKNTKPNDICGMFYSIEKPKPKKGLIKIDNFIDNANQFYEMQPYFYDKNSIWWIWKDYKWEMTDDTEMSRMLDNALGFEGQTISSSLRNNHLEAMKWVGREKKPKPAKPHWIQFKDKAYSLTKKVYYEVQPNYFFTNPIPWEVGTSEETPTMDKLFTEWVGESYKQTLYEIIAYCCFTNYPIHSLFCFIGSGRNGKTQFQKVLIKFIGKENCCATELDNLLNSRFESVKLYKKLVCSMGETNFGIINKTSMLKKLTGQDLIGFEIKGKQGFDDYNYAKIMINSNSLPSSEDTSEGFYRRWIIIDFCNRFEEGHEIFETIPDIEYKNLAKKVIRILMELLERGKFTNQGTVEERKHKYILSSNPFEIFIKERCELDVNYSIQYGKLYSEYCDYLTETKKRVISKKEFSTILSMSKFEVDKKTIYKHDEEQGIKTSTTANYIYGVRMKNWSFK